MKKVYLVQAGYYPNSSFVHAICETKKIANFIKKELKDKSTEIDCITLHTSLPKVYKWMARANPKTKKISNVSIMCNIEFEQSYFIDYEKLYCAYGETKEHAEREALIYMQMKRRATRKKIKK